jgi:hypothetical protein
MGEPGHEGARGVVTLHCLGGRPAAPAMERDLRSILALPEAARAHMWEALGPCLAEPFAPEAEAVLDAFCGAYGAPEVELARAIKACRILLRDAAAIDLDRGHFAEDVDALSGGSPEIREMLLHGYDRAKAAVRTEMVRGTLSDHGKLLLKIDWRLDAVDVSNRGSRLMQSVAMLTLRYREGEQDGRMTVQVLPETLRELRAICDALLA